jgi:hypothetical protein
VAAAVTAMDTGSAAAVTAMDIDTAAAATAVTWVAAAGTAMDLVLPSSSRHWCGSSSSKGRPWRMHHTAASGTCKAARIEHLEHRLAAECVFTPLLINPHSKKSGPGYGCWVQVTAMLVSVVQFNTVL